MDLSSLLHLGGDYRNHKMILIDTFLPGFSLLGDNIDPRGVIWDTQETAETERERGASAKIQDLMLLPNIDTWIGCWIFIYLLLRLRPFFFVALAFGFVSSAKEFAHKSNCWDPQTHRHHYDSPPGQKTAVKGETIRLVDKPTVKTYSFGSKRGIVIVMHVKNKMLIIDKWLMIIIWLFEY